MRIKNYGEFCFAGDSYYDRKYFETVNFSDDLDTSKPIGGLWLCPYLSNKHPSEWIDFVEENGTDPMMKDISHITIFGLKDDARVLILDDPHLFEKEYGRFIDRREGRLARSNIKFDEVKKEYDAFFVDGSIVTSLSTTSCAFLPVRLYGWDVETLYVMNPDILIEKDRFIL